MLMWPALLALGGAALGAGLSSRSADKSRAMGQQQFNAQMDQTIQRRVKDAEKAGIHPIHALGASSGASPTFTAQDRSGQMIAEGVQEFSRNIQGKELVSAQIESEKANQQRNYAEAALASARAGQIRSATDSQGRDGVTIYPEGGAPGQEPLVFGPSVPYNPEVPVSQQKGVRAGNVPETIRVTLKDGRTMDVPSDDVGDEIKELVYAYKKGVYWTSDQMTKVHNVLSRLTGGKIRRVHK